jgi:3-oxoacyl-[acyl-carrier-protein] synthase III
MQSTIKGVAIKGVAAGVPKTIQAVINSGYATEKDRLLFSKTTGIENRRVAFSFEGHNVCTSDLCQAAAEQVLAEAQWPKASIDLLIFISQSPDHIAPATAISLQHRMGLPKKCAAFDINLGCSGFTYGLGVAASMMKGGGFKRALLMVGDATTRGLMPSQVETAAPVFGDGGSATLLELDDTAPPIYLSMYSDGSGAEAIMNRYGGSRHFFPEDTFHYESLGNGCYGLDCGFQMDGLEVFNFTVREVPPTIAEMMSYANTTLDNMDYVIFHQANRLINETLRKALKIPVEKYPYSLQQFGNTSSATIPLTMVTNMQQRLRTEPLTLLMSGFGIGLSWATVVCQTQGIACPSLVEVDIPLAKTQAEPSPVAVG